MMSEGINKEKWILVAFLTLLLFAALTAHASAWYDTDWGYRKSFTVNNTGSELTDYQIMFTVNRSAGSDSGTTVYLDGKCAEDYDDIRFVAADDITLYSYWIENSNSTIASVWVNFTSLPTGDTIAYLYYGNSGASAVSDGDATFPFFDHFDGDALDTDKWTVDSGTPLVSGSVLNLSGSITQKISGKTSFGYNYRFEIRGYHPSNNQAVFGFWSSSEHRTMWLGRAANTNDYVQTRDGPTYTLTDDGIDRSGTTYYIYGGVTRSGASDFYIDRVFRRTLTTHIPTDDMPIALTCEANKGTVCVDWVLVRKYFATEPTVSAWESEEEVPPYWIIADFTGTPTSGGLPLTVYFTDTSTVNNCTIDTWQWAFGDSTSNSTAQNPAHTYTTTGLYDVILTITNTSFSLTNSTIKADYINVTSGGATPTPTTPTPTPTVTVTGTTPTATGTVPPSEVNQTTVGETWIRWVWDDPGELVDIYIDGVKAEEWVSNTTQSYRITGLNPSERHILSLYRAGNVTLIDEQEATTLPATWLIVSVLAISIFFAVCVILSRDIYRVLLCSTISCISSAFLAMIGVGHPWGISIIGIIVALLTGVITVLVVLEFRRGDEDE